MTHNKVLTGKKLSETFPDKAIRSRYLDIMEQGHMTNKAFKMLKNGLNPCDTCESFCWIDPEYDNHINEVEKINTVMLFDEPLLLQQCHDCYLRQKLYESEDRLS